MTARLIIDLPEEVGLQIEAQAKARGLTPEEFASLAVTEKAAADAQSAAYLSARAARARPGVARAILGRSGGEPPRPGDEVD